MYLVVKRVSKVFYLHLFYKHVDSVTFLFAPSVFRAPLTFYFGQERIKLIIEKLQYENEMLTKFKA